MNTTNPRFSQNSSPSGEIEVSVALTPIVSMKNELSKDASLAIEEIDESEGESHSSSQSSASGRVPPLPIDLSKDEEEMQSAVVQEIEKETKSYVRLLPLDFWKKIVYKR